MNITFGKIFFLLVCLVGYSVSFSQTGPNIRINGTDSITLKITTDTAKKLVHVNEVKLKDSAFHLDTAFHLAKPKFGALKDSLLFYEAIKKLVQGDVKAKLADTIKVYLAKNKEFTIQVMPVVDTAITVTTPVTLPVIAEEKSWLTLMLETTTLLVVFIILLVVILALAYLLYVSKKPKVSIVEKVVLPAELVDLFPEIKKDNELAASVRKIRQVYFNLEQELNEYKRKNEQAKKQIIELEAQGEKTSNELAAVKQELLKKQQEIVDIENGNEAFRQRARKLLEKYYTELSITLEQNKLTDRDAIYALIVSNLIPFSLHSASILKKQIKDASGLDELNLQWLDGEQPMPKGEITDNTQFGHADPLAYYIYHLLKTHQVAGLQEVFVKGYKIGK